MNIYKTAIIADLLYVGCLFRLYYSNIHPAGRCPLGSR